MKIINCVGTRPNLVKISPIVREMQKHDEIKQLLLHTGQHYDETLSKSFFKDLSIPEPDYNLGVGSKYDIEQTSEIMSKFKNVLTKEQPDLVLVVGDVNSTLACALTAAKLHTPVAHVEAGLRSGNFRMQEEVNRVLTDRVSDYLFATTKDDVENLLSEGIRKEKVFLVGDVVVDALLHSVEKARESMVLQRLGLGKGDYCLLTMHRAENVDYNEVLSEIVGALGEIQSRIKIVYPMHPRARKMLRKFGFDKRMDRMKNLLVVEPQGYLDFMNLMSNSKCVITDSGGVQSETMILGVPCITIRNETEWLITVKHGTNVVVGTREDRITEETLRAIREPVKKAVLPKLWDGKTAERIVRILLENYRS